MAVPFATLGDKKSEIGGRSVGEPTGEIWLSAVVPNYNDAALLPRAVAALAQQDPPPDEIIVVDDGSTDNSLDVIDQLAGVVPGMRFMCNERNLGPIPTLNRGLAGARGRYVYMASANDTVAPGFFAAARRMLNEYPDCGFFSAECRIVDKDGRELAVRPAARPAPRASLVPSDRAAALLQQIDNFTPSSSVVMLRSAGDAEGWMQPKLGSFADGYLMRRLALRHGFCFSPTVVANWTFDPAGAALTTANNPDIALGILETALAMIRADSVFPSTYPALFERRWRFGVGRVGAGASREVLMGLEAVVATNRGDASVWRGLARIPGKLGRFLRIVWLTLRFHPFSLRAIAATQTARWLERRTSAE